MWQRGSETVKSNVDYYHGQMREMQDRFILDTEKLTKTVDQSIDHMFKVDTPHSSDI